MTDCTDNPIMAQSVILLSQNDYSSVKWFLLRVPDRRTTILGNIAILVVKGHIIQNKVQVNNVWVCYPRHCDCFWLDGENSLNLCQLFMISALHKAKCFPIMWGKCNQLTSNIKPGKVSQASQPVRIPADSLTLFPEIPVTFLLYHQKIMNYYFSKPFYFELVILVSNKFSDWKPSLNAQKFAM